MHLEDEHNVDASHISLIGFPGITLILCPKILFLPASNSPGRSVVKITALLLLTLRLMDPRGGAAAQLRTGLVPDASLKIQEVHSSGQTTGWIPRWQLSEGISSWVTPARLVAPSRATRAGPQANAEAQAETSASSQAVGQRAPEVSGVEPASAGRGSLMKLKVKGKNFAPGSRISFSNPGIRVLEITHRKASELIARIQIAPDAPVGNTSIYVANPDDTEVESQFSVTEEGAITDGQTPAAPGGDNKPESSKPESGSKPASSGSGSPGSAGSTTGQHFEVYSLGKVGAILKSPGNAAKGTLALAGGKLTYTDEDKRVFSARRSEIREVEPNVLLGVNTGTFHVILNSGKTYNFIAGSFRPADAESIVNSLQHWLRGGSDLN